jgi:hypothetical protein
MEPDLAFALLALDRDLLESFTDADLMAITSNMTPNQRIRFYIEKNIKIFGGINPYIEDIVENTNIYALNPRESREVLKLLLAIMKYPNITAANKLQIRSMIDETLTAKTAPAAGGKRRTRRAKRKAQKGRKID